MNDDPLRLARTVLDEYTSNFRRLDLPRLEISGLYDLFPSKPHSLAEPAEHSWPVPYPSDQRAGVYLIFSDTFELLYVGKASMASCLGKRLYTYFGAARECALKHTTWTQSPRFILTVAVPESMPFEAPALEEFLIGRLEPTNNSVGR